MDDLWANVRVYMHACAYGVVIFEEIEQRSFNPSVALELGYMYALRRNVLLLKDGRMPQLPTDVIGKIYRSFDSYRIAETVGGQMRQWLENDMRLGRVPSPEPS